MITEMEWSVLAMCVEEFLYGKISVLCALTCTLAKEVQLFPGLGIYSGKYLLYASKESTGRMPTIISYVLCLLYQATRIHFSEWEVEVVVVCPRRA